MRTLVICLFLIGSSYGSEKLTQPDFNCNDIGIYSDDDTPTNVRTGPIVKVDNIVGKIPAGFDPAGDMESEDFGIYRIIGAKMNSHWVLIEYGPLSLSPTPTLTGWVSGKTLHYTTNGGTNNLHAKPSAESDVVGTVGGEIFLPIKGCQGDYLKVEFKGEEVFLHKDSMCLNTFTTCA